MQCGAFETMEICRKICLLILAGLLLSGFAFSAAAAEGQGLSPKLSIPKGVSVYGSGETARGPEVRYTYSISPAEIPFTEKDRKDLADGKQVLRSGVPGGARLADAYAVFSGEEVALTDGHAEVTDDILISVDPSLFPGIGIYRYVIMDETPEEELAAAGIRRPEGYETGHFFDIYVKTDNTETAPEIYAYILSAGAGEERQYAFPAERTGFLLESESEDRTDKFYADDVPEAVIEIADSDVPLAAGPVQEGKVKPAPTSCSMPKAPWLLMLLSGLLLLTPSFLRRKE